MSSNLPMVFSVTSGKGGVGKTNISVNLACNLSRMGKKVILLDADLGLANVDVILGIAPKYNLFHLFHDGVGIKEVLHRTEFGFDILPASSGISDMVSLSTGQKLDLLDAMDHLEDEIDYLIVDTGAGINENVLYFNLAVQERLLVLTPEPTSLTDAYALIKVMKLNHGVDRFKVLVNMAPDMATAKEVFKKLYMACDHFLSGVSLELTGVIPRDPKMRDAVIQQTPLCKLAPSSPACMKIAETAKKITTWKSTSELDGNIKFFWKKLLFQEQSVA
ncbi:MinD/ParA family protein [Maridesulfovibrio frigidus]|uniref:MinD/ParA family protein n=1 Tax=Maridesulfovibrio frigidus TaxID=340956 RepID=UPI0004E19A72|nr:MinD/ParA family protein [Maridesulfovibrio frigidus]